MLWALLTASLLAPGGPSDSPNVHPSNTIASSGGFSTIVVNHVNRTLGTERLPAARGYPVEAGVFVTIGLEHLQIFDGDRITLSQGRPTDNTVASECESGCAASLFDIFQHEWLKLAVESTALAVRIPTSVGFAMDSRVPARTLIEASYAVSETRPIGPPSLSILVNSPGRGLRGQPFFMIPPRGLRLQQGAAALGLTIEFDGGSYRITAEDAELVDGRRARDLKSVRAITASAKKRHPGKETVILVPGERVSVGELMAVVRLVRVDFPQIVLSAGQDVLL